MKKLRVDIAKLEVVAKNKIIKFYGDGQLSPTTLLFYFPDVNMACDFSECGMYVTNGLLQRGEKGGRIALDDLLFLLEDGVMIKGDNNGIARFLRINNIKNVGDLINHFRKQYKYFFKNRVK
ncbi:MAG: hypothetical protein QXH91_04145 [Candidatus Bathyarchaeia archaeon]